MELTNKNLLHPRGRKPARAATPLDTYWTLTVERACAELQSSPSGLRQSDATQRLARSGPNALHKERENSVGWLLLSQFKSPLVLILIFAAAVSIAVGELTDAIIVLAVVLGSTALGFVQEHRAGNAVAKLRSQVTAKSNVLRDGQPRSMPSEDVTPGDVLLLSAGSLIPADGLVLESNDFFVNQAVLTGETFPVEKTPGCAEASASLANRANCVFSGTSVRSGSARVLIVQTGEATVFGQIADKLNLRPEQTDFERGVQSFGFLLTQVMFVMVLIVLSVNILLHKPPIDSLLFALALAVGLTPELLPAIISITLAHGAQKMVKRGVIVRRLNAIENFGSMDVLCTDKTGTLTEGVVRLDGALDSVGQPSSAVLRAGYLNAHFQTGMANPLDEAISASAELAGVGAGNASKVDEIPYDFVRKRLSVISADAQGVRTLITKGALDNVLAICAQIQVGPNVYALDRAQRAQIDQRFNDWSAQGFRVLGVATKSVAPQPGEYSFADERDLVFNGFLLFFDPPKTGVRQVITDLAARGVRLKMITGDNQKVARHVADAVNLPIEGVLTGSGLNDMNDEALWNLAERTTIFAEVDPNQKERIIRALQKSSHVVGYMGDGINDAPALLAADVGISVDTAVDVAKEAADFVLLKQDLDILRDGIDEGRRTFANTLKYILTTVSANFGNMVSMAGASLFLPFLPLLAPQILLNNFLSDIPAATIASDNVDPEQVAQPRRWNARFIRNYMVLFGLVSSVFDFLTFGTLLFVFRANPETFRTGWFIESLLTELVIALVVRTHGLFFRSRPSAALLLSTAGVMILTVALPYLPFAATLGFVPLPPALLLTVLGLTATYVVVTEVAKRFFYSRLIGEADSHATPSA